MEENRLSEVIWGKKERGGRYREKSKAEKGRSWKAKVFLLGLCDAARHAQPIGHAQSLSRYLSDNEVSDMRS